MSDPDLEADAQILDAEMRVEDDEYVRRRRLKAINDAREHANKAQSLAWAAYLDGDISERERGVIVFSTAQRFLREVRKPIEQVEGSRELIESKPLGTWRPASPSAPEDSSDEDGPASARLVGVASPAPIKVDADAGELTPVGIRFMYRSQPTLDLEWEATFERHYRADDTRRLHTQEVVPEPIALAALDLAINLLDKTELNLQTHDDDTAGFSYRDILENGPPDPDGQEPPQL